MADSIQLVCGQFFEHQFLAHVSAKTEHDVIISSLELPYDVIYTS
jgi:hypothetical protein